MVISKIVPIILRHIYPISTQLMVYPNFLKKMKVNLKLEFRRIQVC